ncbi:hypothetical protein [Alicyclobacillus macrosporangiidus]|nr:hypothetical protein [Alicyclobacillus macrosporangiidus]
MWSPALTGRVPRVARTGIRMKTWQHPGTPMGERRWLPVMDVAE